MPHHLLDAQPESVSADRAFLEPAGSIEERFGALIESIRQAAATAEEMQFEITLSRAARTQLVDASYALHRALASLGDAERYPS